MGTNSLLVSSMARRRIDRATAWLEAPLHVIGLDERLM
jgi:hypothetical protein